MISNITSFQKNVNLVYILIKWIKGKNMDYKSIKTNTVNDKTDIYLVGVFTDKKLSHLGKSITKTNLTLANKCFAKNNFTGEIGDHRTFDDNVGNTQIVFFGLGQKQKYNPLNLSRSVKGIIHKIRKTNAKNISINIDNIISKTKNISLDLLISYIEDSFYKYSFKKENRFQRLVIVI